MKRKRYWLVLLAACGALLVFASPRNLIAAFRPMGRALRRSKALARAIGRSPEAVRQAAKEKALTPFFAAVNFEPAVAPNVQFIGRGRGLVTLLTREGISVRVPEVRGRREADAMSQLHFATLTLRATEGNRTPPAIGARLRWRGERRLRGVSNYFIGRDSRGWRLRVPHFAAASSDVSPGVKLRVYGNDRGIEYDVRLDAGVDLAALRFSFGGAQSVRMNGNGDLLLNVSGTQLTMKKPQIYQDSRSGQREGAGLSSRGTGIANRRHIAGGYILYSDGSIGFRAGPYDASEPLVIDPSVSLAYATFLGGAGTDTVGGVAVDSSGDIYVGGTTTSPATFTEPLPYSIGSSGDAAFFIAKFDPTQSGANSLEYLTFIGGNGDESGGKIAVDASGDAAIAGTTTSSNYPVSDSSARTAGANDTVVTEIGPSGSNLIFSTLFGGNGAEDTQGSGGIAVDGSGQLLVAADTTSTDLPVTAGAFQPIYGGGGSDGFLAIFQPAANPALQYCTYFGIDAQVSIGGIAVDAGGKAYVTGSTSDPNGSFPVTASAIQSVYGGDPSDAFLMKIIPAAKGSNDLEYATLLGGGGMDGAFGVAVDANNPPNAYVTGATRSSDFPIAGMYAAYQSKLMGQANAFLSVIAETAANGGTSLAYSTYLGGTQSDQGQAVAIVPPAAGSATPSDEVYVVGAATSWDLPWRDNFQPFNGETDAFVAKFDPAAGGNASLVYATPMGGIAPEGISSLSGATAIALDPSGNAIIAGSTNAADFPLTANPGNGVQLLCASCTESTPLPDAFLLKLSESALAPAGIRFNAATVRFASAPVGGGSGSVLPVGVINSGEAPLVISTIQISGPNALDFSLMGSLGCTSGAIAPGDPCSFNVSFAPTSVGPESAFVSFQDNAPGNPQVLALEGTGEGALAVVSPASVDFGSEPENVPSPAQTITLKNAGNQDLTIASVALSGPDVAEFTPGQGSTCFTALKLTPGETCAMEITFESGAPGTFHAEIDATDNSGGVASATQIIPLTGAAVLPAPIAEVAPVTLSFGAQTVGSSSGYQTATISNTGSASLTLSSVSISGADAAEFAISQQGTAPCPVQGGTVAAAGNCTVAVRFAPQSGGAKSATLAFTDNATGSPQIVALSGTGLAPAIQISPLDLTFAGQSVGTPSKSQAITIKDTGSSPLAINGIAVAGADAADYAEANNCPLSLAANASCTVSVTFQPTAAGSRAAQIVVADDGASSPQIVALSGTGIQTAATVAPSSIGFGGQALNTAGTAVPVIVTNTGSAALVVSGISFTGPDAGDFIEADTCTSNLTLSIAPGLSCSIQVNFQPVVAGPRAASLVIADNAPGSPQMIPLSGTGMDFNVTDPPDMGTRITVAAGQRARYTLQVNSLYGFTGPVAVACSGAPPAGACYLDPMTVAVPANGSASFQVSVTSQASSLILGPTRAPGSPNWNGGNWRGVACAFALALIAAGLLGAFGEGREGSRKRFVRLAPLATLAVLAAFAAVACGSHSNASRDSGTPPGTYSVVVTATSGKTSRMISLTLIVQ
ncbi:MAG TPA: choice-of-anchor D domain-containing protein [Candidatus Acidoferrales bacterium]|nr:choice-of-anchor D domain-containing protein [Candidatus Acidoferrales bacterium]